MKEDRATHTFRYEDDGYAVEVVVPGDSSLDDMIMHYKHYLIACTFDAGSVNEYLDPEHKDVEEDTDDDSDDDNEDDEDIWYAFKSEDDEEEN